MRHAPRRWLPRKREDGCPTWKRASQTTASRGSAACVAVSCLLTLGACNPPIRQFDLKNQPLTCEQANRAAYHALQSMRFTVTTLEPAAVGRPGRVRGSREERGRTQNVTVIVTCTGAGADIDASEDGRFLGQLEFKRGFYLSFIAVAAQAAPVAEQRVQAPAPTEPTRGLHVLLQPVRGLDAKFEFELDLAAAGVLPVRVTINNATPRTYKFDPADIVLIRGDRQRIRPLPVSEAVRRVVSAAQADGVEATPVPDSAEVGQRLRSQLLTGDAVGANENRNGYLFYPLAEYVKGRLLLEDQASEETEGFVVQF